MLAVKNQNSVQCSICFGEYNKKQQDALRPPLICYPCWRSHISSSITQITYKVGSPISGLSVQDPPIQISSAMYSLTKDHRHQLQEWLLKKYLTFTKDIEKCPSQLCDFAYTMQKCRWGASELFCPKCDGLLIPQRTFTFRYFLNQLYFTLIANNCPKCQIPIQKISGCPHMSCLCGHQFCWHCLKNWNDVEGETNGYSTHEAEECVTVVLTKVIIVITSILSLIMTMSGYDSTRGALSLFITIICELFKAILVDSLLLFTFTFIHNRGMHMEKKTKQKRIAILIVIHTVFWGGFYLTEYLEDILILLGYETGIFAVGFVGYHSFSFLDEHWYRYVK